MSNIRIKERIEVLSSWINEKSIDVFILALIVQHKHISPKLSSIMLTTALNGWSLTSLFRGLASYMDEDRNNNISRDIMIFSSISLPVISISSSLLLNNMLFTRLTSLSGLAISATEKTIEWNNPKKTFLEKCSNWLNIAGLVASIPTKHTPLISPIWSYIGWAASAIPNSIRVIKEEKIHSSEEKIYAHGGAIIGISSIYSSLIPKHRKDPFFTCISSLSALSMSANYKKSNIESSSDNTWSEKVIHQDKVNTNSL